MRTPRRSPEEIIVLVMCAICMAGLLPFAFIRLERGDWLVALIDSIGFVLTAIAFIYVYRTRTVGYAGLFLALLALTGMVFNVYTLGPRDLNFMYPVVMLTYFLVAPRLALAVTGVALVILSIILSPMMGPFEYLKFILSLLGCMLFAYVFAAQRDRQRDQLITQTTIDPLTNAGNRRALHAKLEELIASFKRTGEPMSLVILDLDNFKDINDDEGHVVGDEVLKLVTATIATRIRVTDSLYRYGGDEFVVVANSADAGTAAKLAEDIRVLIAELVNVSRLPVTVSLGVAQYQENDSVDSWIHRADEAMYSAKQAGRNAVSLEPQPGT